MQTIGQSTLRTFCPDSKEIKAIKCDAVRRADAIPVSNYLELAKRVAQLQYENREHVLMYRGQPEDYRNQRKNSTIKPSIFRPTLSKLGVLEVGVKFEILREAEELLLEEYEKSRLPRFNELRRRQVLRWAIIQHYEVCDTPLLDVTQSLRIAASFASDANGDLGFVMILGVPNVAGAITTSIDAELQVLRLSSVCPPQALRPHIQEGFLLGEYPDIGGFQQKQLYADHEVDFGRRLMAKFVFEKKKFWRNREFPAVSNGALYPRTKDDLSEIANIVRERMGKVFE